MIEKKKRFGAFIIPTFVICLGIGNFVRLDDTEYIRAIHIVTLITIGMGIGVLLRNVLTHFAKDNQNDV